MKKPKLGQTVSASGKNGVFKIIRVDEKQGVADLELTTGTHFIEKNIPFNSIHSLEEDVNQAAARIVRKATEG
jgi:translation initiation factor 2 alpha subunit (eIF-2alpha)